MTKPFVALVQTPISKSIELPKSDEYVIETFNVKGFNSYGRINNLYEKYKDYNRVMFCSIMMANRFKDKKDGIILSFQKDAYDWNYYSTLFPNEYLLNGEGKILRLCDLSNPLVFDADEIFVRPISGWKPFTGFSCKLVDLKIELDTLGYSLKVPPHTLVGVFPAKKILKEFRFWVLDFEVVTGSSYSFDDDHVFEKPPIEVENFAKKMIKYLPVMSEYTIDIAIMENGDLKVVEINGFSTSGWYGAMDIDKLIKSIKGLYV